MLGVMDPYSRLVTLEGIIKDCAPHVKLTGVVSAGTLAASFASYVILAIQMHYDQPGFSLGEVLDTTTLVSQTFLDTDFYPPTKMYIQGIMISALVLAEELLPPSTEMDLLLGIVASFASVSEDPQ